MRTPQFQTDWPSDWQSSFSYDCKELFDDRSEPGYTLAYQERFKATVDLVKEYLPKQSSILDVAAGQGNFSLTLAEAGYTVTWNDLREDLIDYVKLKYEYGELDFQPGNIFEVNNDKLFDCVLATEVIEHVAHPDEFLKRLVSFLKPDGKIVISTPNGEHFRNKLPSFSDCPDPSIYEKMQFKPNADGHIFLLHPHELHSLAQQTGLVVKKLVYVSNPLINGHLKLRYLLPYLPKKLVLGSQKLVRLSPVLERKISIGMVALLVRNPL